MSRKDAEHKTRTCRIAISGVTCATCTQTIRDACLATKGVLTATVSLQSLSARITYRESSLVTPRRLVDIIEKSGYGAISVSEDNDWRSQWLTTANTKEEEVVRWSGSFRASAIASGTVALFEAADSIFMPIYAKANPFLLTAKLGIGTISVLLLGLDLHREAWWAIVRRKPNSSLLASCGLMFTLSAVLLPARSASSSALSGSVVSDTSYFTMTSPCLLMTVLLGSRLIRSLVSRRSTQFPATLAAAIPSTAQLLDGLDATSNLVSLPTESLQSGDTVLVQPNSPFPADGQIIKGQTEVLETIIKGELKPRAVEPGSKIYAGSTNGARKVVMEVSTVGMDTWLGQTLRAVSEADEVKTGLESLSDRLLDRFSVAVIGLAIGTGLYHWSTDAAVGLLLSRVASVFLCACPCALGLSVPICTMASICKCHSLWTVGSFADQALANAFRAGILLRPGPQIELVSKANVIVFDKTGTLTSGELEATKIKIEPRWKEDATARLEFWKAVAVLTQKSSHPVSALLSSEAQKQLTPSKEHFDLATAEVKSYQEHPGRGVTGRVFLSGREHDVAIGNIPLLQRANVFVNQESTPDALESSESVSKVYISIDGTFAGQVSYKDSIIPGIRSVVRELRSRGFKTYIMTGDSSSSANGVGSYLGIDRSRVHASLLPHEKADLVHRLRSQYGHVVMVGDNANDVPALVASTFGIVVSQQPSSRVDTSASCGDERLPSVRAEGDARLLPADTEDATACHSYFSKSIDPRSFQRILYILDLTQTTTKRMHQALLGSLIYNTLALSLASGLISALAPAKAAGWLDLSPYVILPSFKPSHTSCLEIGTKTLILYALTLCAGRLQAFQCPSAAWQT